MSVRGTGAALVARYGREAAIEAWLNSRFTPATRNGRAVESRLQAKTVFAIAGAGTYASADAFGLPLAPLSERPAS